MFYLILAILSGTANSLIFRVSGGRVKSKFSMLAANYLVCLGLALFYLFPAPLVPRDPGLSRTALLGLINGFLFLCGFVMIQRNTRVHGVVLTAIFSRLGVLVPTALAVTLFHEIPTAAQTLGFLLALAAILLMNLEKGAGFRGFQIALVVMLLFNGSCDAMAKVYEQFGSPALSEHFLVYSFFFALLFNVLLVLYKGERPGLADFCFGALLGVPNYFVARVLLRAVENLPAVIVYPTFSVSTIVVTAAAGVILFHEKIGRRQGVAIGMILIALVLLNV